MLSISKIISNFNKELARPSKFEVEFTPPSGLRSSYKGTFADLKYRCENAQLPSRTIMTTDQRIYGYAEKFPDGTSYEDISFTFIVSDDMLEKKIFDDWLKLVQPTDSYNIKFKQEYQTKINVKQFNLAGNKTYEVELRKAYPIAINQLDLDWGAEGYHKLLVVFAYSEWSVV